MKKLTMPKPKQFHLMNSPKGAIKLRFGKGLGIKSPRLSVKGK